MIEGARRGRYAAAAGVVLFSISTVALFVVSRGKWSHAIIDSGREWIVPDALASGDLLYRDIVYWFGPFTPYFHAAFFRVLGSSFSTLVIAGLVGSLGVLTALFLALRSVTNRLEAALWTALAVPALVFMPNGGGSILGMGYRIWHAAAFGLGAVALAARTSPDRRPVRRAIAIGVLVALAGLCRTEWGLVSGAAAFIAFCYRERSASARVRTAAAGLLAFVVVFGGTIAAFIAAAGPEAVLEEGHVLLAGLPSETRNFLLSYSGVRDWRSGVLELLYSSAAWGGALLLLQIIAIGRSDRARVLRKLPLLAIALLLLVLCAALGGAGRTVLFSAAPLVCAGAAVLALARPTPSSAALLGFAIAGTLFSYRRPFHIADGAYVGPPLLFAVTCAAGLVQRLLDREKDPRTRKRLRSCSLASVFALIVFAFAGRAKQYVGDERFPLPGTQGMLSDSAERVAKFASLSQTIEINSGSGEGLVVFPEGEVLNYLTGRPNPLRHKLYIPGYLTRNNESKVLAELNRSPPEVIVVLHRPTTEYGPAVFGVSYGQRIRNWIEQRYDLRPIDPGERVVARLGSWAVLGVRKKYVLRSRR